MNRSLLVFSILLIVAGLFVGIEFVPLIGIFLLVVALLLPETAGQKPRSGPAAQQPEPPSASELSSGRMQSTPAYSPMIVTGVPAATPAPSGYEQRSAMGSPALFPTPMFPSFSQPEYPMRSLVEEIKEEKKEERRLESRDEIVELVALLAILRLTSR